MAEIWIVVYNRVYMRWELGRDQQRLRRLGCDIQVALKEDMIRRVPTVGEDMKILLNRDPNPQAKHGGRWGGGIERRWTKLNRIMVDCMVQ